MTKRMAVGLTLLAAGVAALNCAEEPALEFAIECPGVQREIALERYIAVGDRDTPLPAATSPEYVDLVPPRCVPALPEGEAVSAISAALDDEPLEVTRDRDGARMIILPPLPPGEGTLAMTVTSSSGVVGTARRTFNWNWAGANIDVAARALRVGDGELNFILNYDGPRINSLPEFNNNDGVQQQYEFTWDFGDGGSSTNSVDERVGRVEVVHPYEQAGTYRVQYSIRGSVYRDWGTGNFEIVVAEDGGVRVRNLALETTSWLLADVEDSPALQQRSENDRFMDENFGIEVIETSANLRAQEVSGRQFSISRSATTGDNGDYIMLNGLIIAPLPQQQRANREVAVAIGGESVVNLWRMEALNQPPTDRLIISFPGTPHLENKVYDLSPGETFIEVLAVPFPLPGTLADTFEVRACVETVNDIGAEDASVLEADILCSNWEYNLDGDEQ